MNREARALEKHRNNKNATIDWEFKTEEAKQIIRLHTFDYSMENILKLDDAAADVMFSGHHENKCYNELMLYW